MFKLLFRTITIILVLIVLITGLAVWKGGEPFRWAGKKIEAVGESIIKFGGFVDELREGGKKAQKTIKELKDTIEGNGAK